MRRVRKRGRMFRLAGGGEVTARGSEAGGRFGEAVVEGWGCGVEGVGAWVDWEGDEEEEGGVEVVEVDEDEVVEKGQGAMVMLGVWSGAAMMDRGARGSWDFGDEMGLVMTSGGHWAWWRLEICR